MLEGANCTHGVFILEMDCQNGDTNILFPDIYIMEHSQQSTIIEDALRKRRQMNIDPYKSEFSVCTFK